MRFDRTFSIKTMLGTALFAGAAAQLLSGCQRGVEIDPLPELQVAAVFDDEQIQIRYRYETDAPSWHHEVVRYEGGRWVRHGSQEPGAGPHRLQEDRIAMMLDDGAVKGFDRFGAFMTVHHGVRTMANPIDGEAVRQHPWLGEQLGQGELRKFLPQSREVDDPSAANWDRVKDPEALLALREQGVFLDLWQWHAHRGNPIGHADNGYILDSRHDASGKGMYASNWDEATQAPRWMFDAAQTGFHALEWERLIARGYGQDEPYYLAEGHALPFDPTHQWQEGDVLPLHMLRSPIGSRGAITAQGRWVDGAWEVSLTRSLSAPNPLDSKTLAPGGVYHVSFAVHEASGARWHRVSLPLTLGLEAGADIIARRAEGPLDEAEASWQAVPLIRPSKHVSWQWLHSDHGGARRLADEGERRGLAEVHGAVGLERRMRLLDRRMVH